MLSDKIPESHLQVSVKNSLSRTCSFHYFLIEEDCYSEDYAEVVTFDGA